MPDRGFWSWLASDPGKAAMAGAAGGLVRWITLRDTWREFSSRGPKSRRPSVAAVVAPGQLTMPPRTMAGARSGAVVAAVAVRVAVRAGHPCTAAMAAAAAAPGRLRAAGGAATPRARAAS